MSTIEQELKWLEDGINLLKLLAPYDSQEDNLTRLYIPHRNRTNMNNKVSIRIKNLSTIAGDLCISLQIFVFGFT